MRWQRVMRGFEGIVGVVIVIGVSAVGGGGAASRTAQAAPAMQTTATAAAYAAPHEASKVTLRETSMDGPALWTQRGPSAPVGPAAVLAWTGMDGRLNFVFSNDGINFFGKTTLHETSFVRPAVARGTGEGGFVAPVALAWTGVDAGHHLNVLYDAPRATLKKLTLSQDTSFTSPALEWLNEHTLLLAWAGTDSGHSLNTLPVSVTDQGLLAGTKATFRTFHSLGQPTLINEFPVPLADQRLFLGWSDMASHHIAWATSTNGTSWTQQPSFVETSGAAPSMMGLTEQLAHVPPYWLGWTGADAAHHVNVLYALTLSQWTTNYVKAKLPETAVGGTVVGFVLSPPDQQILVAWTGTDAAHHLNVARVGV
ncbi:MAG TPA: hypothetical protein VE338_18780 [Ktedonobacterales bacterium]|nr:hypothetical protein [Ktedonobacterales bacterium]